MDENMTAFAHPRPTNKSFAICGSRKTALFKAKQLWGYTRVSPLVAQRYALVATRSVFHPDSKNVINFSIGSVLRSHQPRKV